MRLRLLGACGFVMLGLLVYGGLWSAGFVYEDSHVLTNIPPLVPMTALGGQDVWAALGMHGLARLTWGAARWYGHTTPGMFHAFSLGVHLVNTLLVTAALWAVTRDEPVAWTAGALFLVTPLNSEAVSYIAAQQDLLVVPGIAIAVGVAAMVEWGPWRWGAVLIGLILGLWGKETAIVGVGLIALAVRIPRRWWLLLAVPAVVALARVGPLVARLQNDYGLHHGGFGYLAYTAIALWRDAAVSVGLLRPSLDIDYVVMAHSTALLALTALGLVTIAAWRLRHRWPLIGIGWGWYVMALIPRLFVRSPEYLHEHQTYLASIGLCLLIAAATKPLAWSR